MDLRRAQMVEELKSEVEYERRLRQKAESLSQALARQLTEERAGREAMERVCEGLAEAMTAEREEMERLVGELEEEKKMMRVAEVLREERVRMKLAEARILMEEKLREIDHVGAGRGDQLSIMGLYGEFELGLQTKVGLHDHCNPTIKKEAIKSRVRAHGNGTASCFSLFSSSSSTSSSSDCVGGRKNLLACKENKRQKDQLRIVLLREKS